MKKYERGNPNVYADLGRPDAGEMRVKAQLAAQISRILKQSGLTQLLAADQLGMAQPRLSNLLCGQFRGISEVKMMELLTRLGQDVQIVVKPPGRARNAGQITVVGEIPAIRAARASTLLRVRERVPAYRAGTGKKWGFGLVSPEIQTLR